MRHTCFQINLNSQFGGGEIYTRFFGEALLALGWNVVTVVSREAPFWDGLMPPGARFLKVGSSAEMLEQLPPQAALIVTHTVADVPTASKLAERHVLTGFAHMPLFDRNPPGFALYHRIFAVSQHVLDSLRWRGYANAYPQPLYGVADVARGNPNATLVSRSSYDWDRRKFRDRLLGVTEPLWNGLFPKHPFQKRQGLALGIVSRITPIKQLPLMFELLAPVLKRFPQVNLEIFGNGGYASVRDLRQSLKPIASQVRYWGYQENVAAVYRSLDFVLSGLPEKEALGLNLIEAQCCGTPVLAVRAPPFTETVVEGKGGLFFTDPREDAGADFERLLARLLGGMAFPRPQAGAEYLEKFRFEHFCERVQGALKAAGVAA
jgi:glycosyltransferase involved in cell wall biosynthesis